MSPEILFQIHLVLGYVAWLLCFAAYGWPRLKSMDRVPPCVQKQLKLEQLRLCRIVQDDGPCGLVIVNSRIVEFPAYGTRPANPSSALRS